MDAVGLIAFLVIGVLAGWIAGQIMKGRGFGALGNLAVGVVGAFLGGFLFNFLGLSAAGFVGSLIMAVVLLFVVGVVKKA